MTYKIGCDPEIFVFDTEKRRYVFPTFVPGTKQQPFPVPGGAIQRDGMSAEINIDPANSEEEFIGNIRKVLGELSSLIKAAGKQYKLVPIPAAPLTKNTVASVPKDYLMLGCDPDFNAYNKGAPNLIPLDQIQYLPDPTVYNGNIEARYRTGSGHIHIGWTDKAADHNVPGSPHFIDCMVVANQMDVFVQPVAHRATSLIPNVSSVSIETYRRYMYGKAGAFRPKPYGVEYRTPSNSWLVDETAARHIYRATMLAMEALDKGIVASDPEFSKVYEKCWRAVNHDYVFTSMNQTNNASGQPALIETILGAMVHASLATHRALTILDKDIAAKYFELSVPLQQQIKEINPMIPTDVLLDITAWRKMLAAEVQAAKTATISSSNTINKKTIRKY